MTGTVEAEAAVALADALRSAGINVGTQQVVTYRQALATIDPEDVTDRYWAGRLTLLTDHRDVAAYDAVFAALTTGDEVSPTPAEDGLPPGDHQPAPDEDPSDGRGDDAATASDQPSDGLEGDRGSSAVGVVASDREQLRHRRFDHATDEELARITDELRRFEVAVPRRVSLRTRPGRRGDQIDLARTLEHAMATDGEVLDLTRRDRRTRPRRLVVLLDVSGSMAGHARALLRFALVARRTARREASRRVEVFAFGTRLTRLTDALDDHDPDAALQAAADRVTDWDGGTRIGACIGELTDVWARRGSLRGAVVVICSDGLERGDPDALDAAMARLQRHVHRIVWVNPLAGDARYEPTQRGMRAALPHVDAFLPGHDLASLEELANVLAALR